MGERARWFASVLAVTVLALLIAPLGRELAKASPGDGEPELTPLEGVAPPNTPLRHALPENYREHEYIIEGSARAYPGAPDERMSYRSRILVRTPKDPAAFNGTVVVEWFNVSGQFDNAPDYLSGFQEVHRGGYAWVGVSAQAVGVTALAVTDPGRYGTLEHPGDPFSFDIFSQAGFLLKNPGQHDPLVEMREAFDGDLKLMGTGNSQSAGRLVSYIRNGALRDAGVYDSLWVTSGGSTTPPPPEADMPSVPVLHMQSESESAPPAPPATGRMEHPLYRQWWVAGTSHNDGYWATRHFARGTASSATGVDLNDERDAGQYGEFPGPGGNCRVRVNQFPRRYASNAAIRGLDVWMRTGVPVETAPEFEYGTDGLLARDADENALGGVRLAPIVVPLASYVGNSCGLTGHTTPFTDEVLRARYPTHNDYMNRIRSAVDSNVADAFLLPEDAEDFLDRAEAAAFRWEGPISLPYPLGG